MIKGDQAAALWSFHAGGEARHETQLLNNVVCDDGCLGEVLKAQKRGSMSGESHKLPREQDLCTASYRMLAESTGKRNSARGERHTLKPVKLWSSQRSVSRKQVSW